MKKGNQSIWISGRTTNNQTLERSRKPASNCHSAGSKFNKTTGAGTPDWLQAKLDYLAENLIKNVVTDS